MTARWNSGKDHPTTVFLSVHKGASTFLADKLAPSMMRVFRGLRHYRVHADMLRGKSAADLALPPTGVVATRVYPAHYEELLEDPVPQDGRFADKKLIMLRRDPRDIAVSYFYSWAYSHEPPPDPALREKFFARRERLQAMEPSAGVYEVSARPAIVNYLRTIEFLEKYPDTCLTTYELMVTNFDAWLRQVGDFIGWNDEERARVGRPLTREVKAPEKEDPRRHKRRVTPGAWRDIFDQKTRRLFERKLSDHLTAAGYDW